MVLGWRPAEVMEGLIDDYINSAVSFVTLSDCLLLQTAALRRQRQDVVSGRSSGTNSYLSARGGGIT
jgi:hypothetical protein